MEPHHSQFCSGMIFGVIISFILFSSYLSLIASPEKLMLWFTPVVMTSIFIALCYCGKEINE